MLLYAESLSQILFDHRLLQLSTAALPFTGDHSIKAIKTMGKLKEVWSLFVHSCLMVVLHGFLSFVYVCGTVLTTLDGIITRANERDRCCRSCSLAAKAC